MSTGNIGKRQRQASSRLVMTTVTHEMLDKKLDELQRQLLEINVHLANMGSEVQEGVESSNEHLTKTMTSVEGVVNQLKQYIEAGIELADKAMDFGKPFYDKAVHLTSPQFRTKIKRTSYTFLIILIAIIACLVYKFTSFPEYISNLRN